MTRQYDSRVMKPVKTLVEGITFDSEWEANVYRHIRMLYPKEYVTCHHAIDVLPASIHFPALAWKCDFSLSLPWRKQSLLIEAKGVMNREFKLLLQSLAHTNPDAVANLLVVHPSLGVRLGNTLQTVNIHFMYQYLLKLKG